MNDDIRALQKDMDGRHGSLCLSTSGNAIRSIATIGVGASRAGAGDYGRAVPLKYVTALSNASVPIVEPLMRPAKSSARMWMPPQRRD